MPGFLLRLLVAGLFGISSNVFAENCGKLLVPNFALPGLDTTTDLAYLAAITPENFSLHKANATPKMAHLGVLLPIASDLLQHAADYAAFSERRAQKYTELGFDYPAADLAAYFRRLLPTGRLNAYDACVGATGFVAQVVKADRDVVEILASWSPSSGAAAQVPAGSFAVAGATLIGAPPATVQTQPATLIFIRNLGADLRVSLSAAKQPATVWVPRFIGTPRFPEPDQATCADAGKVVRALFRQTLGREANSAELSAQTALLKNGSNSVRQLAERAVLGDEYQKKFAKGRELEDLLQGLYTRVLGRASDAKGLANNKARLHNAAFPAIALSFFGNAEYEQRFGEWTVPGAAPTIRYCPAQK